MTVVDWLHLAEYLENFESDASESSPVLDEVCRREDVEAPGVDGDDDL